MTLVARARPPLWKRRFVLAALSLLALIAITRVGARERGATVYTTVEERALEVTIPFTGRLRALQVAEYGTPTLTQVWEYRITFLAHEGSVVAAGDPVLQFDTTELEESLRRHVADRDAAASEYQRRRKDFEAERSQQELALEEAKAQERRAQVSSDLPSELVARTKREKAAVDLELARTELSHRGERIADVDRRSKTELATLRDRRDRAAANAEEATRSIELMTVRATFPGTVSHRADRRGNRKKVGDSCWRGERVIEIPAPGALRVDAWVKEAESGEVRAGLPATVWLEAHPERSYPAKVEKLQQTVERRSEIDPGAIVRLELSFVDAGAEQVRPGMRVQGRLDLERRPPRPAVRVAAVIAGPSGPVVERKTLLGTTTVPIEVGRRVGDWVEIESGLTVGDRVLLP